MKRYLLSLAILSVLSTSCAAADINISSLPVPSSGSRYLTNGDMIPATRSGITYQLTPNFGGVCATSSFVNTINNQGVAYCRQPLFSDLSGFISSSQLPANPVFTGNMFATGAYLTPTANTTNQGLNITQTGPSTGGPLGQFAYNSIIVNNDGADAGDVAPPSATSSGLYVELNSGGSNLTGSRTAVFGQFNMTAAHKLSGTMRDFSGGTFYALSAVNDGGTNVASRGALWGMNTSAHLFSGATYWGGVSGGEVDIGIETGASAENRTGWDLASIGTQQAYGEDAALRVVSGSSVSWKNALLLSHSSGGNPLSSDGCVICVGAGGGTIATGIDLSSMTITGDFLKVAKYKIGGNGNVTINNKLSISTTAPTVSSGFGTSPTVTGGSTKAFKVTVGSSPGGTGVLNMGATATNGWACTAHDKTSPGSIVVGVTADTTTTISFQAYSRTTGATTNFIASDQILFQCDGY